MCESVKEKENREKELGAYPPPKEKAEEDPPDNLDDRYRYDPAFRSRTGFSARVSGSP